jgi:hypothetical protein
MEADKFYKNKPKALERIESERVWRYLCVDHYSGSIFCHYVLGAESGANLVESFIRAVTPRTVGGQTDPFCGVPFITSTWTHGSANTGAPVQEPAAPCCRRVIAGARAGQCPRHRRRGAPARHLGARLRVGPAQPSRSANLDELNEAAMIYARFFNATQVHSRTRPHPHGHVADHQRRAQAHRP